MYIYTITMIIVVVVKVIMMKEIIKNTDSSLDCPNVDRPDPTRP